MPETHKILVAVCGGIAAYKAVDLVRELQRSGATVRVIMTRSAHQFIQPLTFASLTGHRVFSDLWDESADAAVIEHIAQAQWADALLIAPATANAIAKLAHGFADDFLSATSLATKAHVVLAPAMNVNMFHHAATQTNLDLLRQRGHTIIAPDSGYLACGMHGDGRLADTSVIVQATLDVLSQKRDLEGETILITAGGTREPIDPVRFLGNRSSGKMGHALAASAAKRGARVILITAASSLPTPAHCERISVNTAREMHAAVLDHLGTATMVVKAAAVADYRVRDVAPTKLHRVSGLTLDLEPTEDIVRSAVDHRRPGTLVIAFAAEMGLDMDRAREKLRRKGADAIVLNDISQPHLGFDSPRNAAIFLTAQTAVALHESTKDEIAAQVLDQALSLREATKLTLA
jgi:phosphopantothenoylcysteine decarboxylase/phosphopantothenate--cysteine ligase